MGDDRTLRGVARLDFGVVRNVERTPIGGLRVDAAITRCGILVYRDTAGNEFREFVPPDEVFRDDSLATLRDAPVTDGHPSDLVTPDTFRSVSRGHVADTPRRDGDLACAPLAIDDAGLIREVDSGERKDISAGYVCDIDPTPGVYEGQPYDRVQRNRRYNHVAVLPPGAGRAGPEVSLRMDGAAVQVRADARAEEQPIVKTPPILKVLGREYKFDEAAGNYGTLEKDVEASQQKTSDAMAQMAAMKSDAAAHDAAIAAVQQALADAMGEVAKLKAALDAVQSSIAQEESGEGEGDETQATEAAPEEVLDSMRAIRREVVRAVGVSGLKKGMRRDAVRALVTKKLDARADARAEEIARVRTDAAKHLTADEAKGKSVDELRRAVVAKLLPTVKMDSLDAKTIATMFDTAVAVAKPVEADRARRESAESNAGVQRALNQRADGEDRSLETLYAKDREDAANRWKNGSK